MLKKIFKANVSLLLIILMLIGSIPVSASDDISSTETTEITETQATTVATEETATEPETVETEEVVLTEETVYETAEDLIVETQNKANKNKGKYSVGATANTIRSGATSQGGIPLADPQTPQNFKSSTKKTNGNPYYLATYSNTRYSSSAADKYTCNQDTYGNNYLSSDGKTPVTRIGKIYKTVVRFQYTSDSPIFTATWVVDDEKSFTNTWSNGKAKEEIVKGTVTMSVEDYNGNATAELPDFYFDGASVHSYSPFQKINKERIKNIIFTKKISKIGENNFRFFDSLETVKIGDKVKNISAYAFDGCYNLQDFFFSTSPVVSLGEGAFKNCYKLKNSYIKDNKQAFNFNGDGLTLPSSYNGSSLTLPYSIKTIGPRCFDSCESLRAICFGDNNGSSSSNLQRICYGAFKNCYNLQYIRIPNSVITIEGTDNYPNSDGGLWGAFYIANTFTGRDKFNPCESKRKCYISIANEKSKLEHIGDEAFFCMQTPSDSYVIYDRVNQRNVSSNISTKFLFPELTYLGTRAFMNNTDFTGHYFFAKNINIRERPFNDTNISGIYVKTWNPDERRIAYTSFIGTSNSFVGGAYVNNDNTQTYKGTTYYSVTYMLDQYLYDCWQAFYQSVPDYSNEQFGTWTTDNSEINSPDPTYVNGDGDINAPQKSVGNENTADSKDDRLKLIAKEGNVERYVQTKNYLKTEVKWKTTGKKATETVHFGYKNDEVIDYIFVVDNSPSMEKAVDDDNTMLSGVQSVSKVMNVYSQTYKLSEKLLTGENTATVIGFNGEIDDNYNNLKKSSYYIIDNAKNAQEVKKALFNDNKYKGVGCTNYSAGLALAYEKISALQTNSKTAGHKQAIIFITDGNPTYYLDGQAISAKISNDADARSKKVNGLDWAAMLRQDKTQGNYNKANDYYTVSSFEENSVTATQTIYSLPKPVKIIGVLVGSENSNSLNALCTGDKTNRSQTVYSKDIENVGKKFVDVVGMIHNEDYVVTIPLDNNFTLDTNTQINIESTVGSAEFRKSAYKVETYSDGVYRFVPIEENVASLGSLKYDTEHNALVWSLQNIDVNSSVSSPYVTYKLTFDLDRQFNKGTIVKGNSSGKTYLRVNTNSHKNNTSTIGSEIGTSDYFSTANPYAGAYVYLAEPNSIDELPTEPTDTGKYLMNVAPAVYLPISTGNANITKLDDSTEQPIAGATFRVYNADGKEVTFIRNDYNNYTYAPITESGTTEKVIFTTSADLQLLELPSGTYYLVESSYPSSYKESSKNTYVNVGSSGSLYGIKFSVSGNTTTSVTVYNHKTPATVRVIGRKLDENGDPVEGAYMGIYASASYESQGFAPFDIAITDSNGYYQFYLSKWETGYIIMEQPSDTLKGHQVNKDYISPDGNKTSKALSFIRENGKLAEITTPEGTKKTLYEEYTSVSGKYSFYYPNLASIINTGEYASTLIMAVDSSSTYDALPDFHGIVDYTLAKINVHVNSSDETKENFEYTLTASGNDINGSTTTTYTGVTGEDGTVTFEVPAYFINNTSTQSITYSLTQTATPNNYYMETRFGNSFDTATEQSSYDIGIVTPSQEKDIYVYNVAARINVKDYDKTDYNSTPQILTPVSSNITLSTAKYVPYLYSVEETGICENTVFWYGVGSFTLTQTSVQEYYRILSAPQSFNIISANIYTTSGNDDNVTINKETVNNNKTGDDFNTYYCYTATFLNTQYSYTIYGYKKDNINKTGLENAVMYLYESESDAQEGNNPIAFALTNSSGYYSFVVRTAGTYYVREGEAPEGYQINNHIVSATVSDSATSVKVSDIIDYKLAQLNIYVNGSDNLKQGFVFTVSNGDNVKFTSSYTDADGYVGVEIPVYDTDFSGKTTFDIPLRIKEVSYNYEPIPEYYMYQEYGYSWDNTTKMDNIAVGITEGSTTTIYCYNMSSKLTIHNYDAVDKDSETKTHPLQSTFVFNSTDTFTTEETGQKTTGFIGYGDYSLEQTQVPNGYNLLADVQSIPINDTTTSYTLKYTDEGNKYLASDYIVYNTKRKELPLTGGNDNRILVVCSIVFLFISSQLAVVYVMRKHKRKTQ
ncbi:MAG: SpaA isopeptide-forming pilin-related protein [Ruminococcus sp.]